MGSVFFKDLPSSFTPLGRWVSWRAGGVDEIQMGRGAREKRGCILVALQRVGVEGRAGGGLELGSGVGHLCGVAAAQDGSGGSKAHGAENAGIDAEEVTHDGGFRQALPRDCRHTGGAD